MDDQKYTIEEIIRFLRFYEEQGCTIQNILEILECDRDIPRIQNKPVAISYL